MNNEQKQELARLKLLKLDLETKALERSQLRSPIFFLTVLSTATAFVVGSVQYYRSATELERATINHERRKLEADQADFAREANQSKIDAASQRLQKLQDEIKELEKQQVDLTNSVNGLTGERKKLDKEANEAMSEALRGNRIPGSKARERGRYKVRVPNFTEPNWRELLAPAKSSTRAAREASSQPDRK